MKGRLEHSLQAEENIKQILNELPEYVTYYYYEFKIGRQPKACLEYIRKIKKFLKFIDDDPKKVIPSEITNYNITKFLDSISYIDTKNGKRESSISYKQGYHSVLKSFFEFLCYNDYIELSTNPMTKIKRAKGNDYINRKFLTENDLKKVLNAVETGAGNQLSVSRQLKWKNRDRAIMMLFMQTGIRETALSEINIDDVDFNNHIIKSVIEKGHKDKTFTMSDQLENAISSWINDRKLICQDNTQEALFLSKSGTRISQKALSDIVSKYTREALGYPVTPHKLRAAFANIMLEKTNANIYIVQQLLGHSRTDTTKIYLNNNVNQYNNMAAQMIADSVFK